MTPWPYRSPEGHERKGTTMSEQEKDVLFDVHGDLVEVETCIEQLGVVVREVATPRQGIDYESMMHFIACSLGMYADRISKAEERIDAVLHGMKSM